jgi:hypothetical protein
VILAMLFDCEVRQYTIQVLILLLDMRIEIFAVFTCLWILSGLFFSQVHHLETFIFLVGLLLRSGVMQVEMQYFSSKFNLCVVYNIFYYNNVI